MQSQMTSNKELEDMQAALMVLLMERRRNFVLARCACCGMRAQAKEAPCDPRPVAT